MTPTEPTETGDTELEPQTHTEQTDTDTDTDTGGEEDGADS